METIRRKSLLYKSGLGFWCVNHAQGCSHGCRYPCYAFSMAKSYGRAKDWSDWCAPKLVENAPELLEAELGRMRAKPARIHFCLSTDPFMFGRPEIALMTLRLVEIANAHGVGCSILTKGEPPAALADTARFPGENSCGISLVSLDEAFREKWEPGAAPYAARIAALKALSDSGLSTLAHVEPYPTPNIAQQDLGALLESVGFVDSLYFGRWNYNPLVPRFAAHREFYAHAAAQVRSFCLERDIEFSGGGED